MDKFVEIAADPTASGVDTSAAAAFATQLTYIGIAALIAAYLKVRLNLTIRLMCIEFN